MKWETQTSIGRREYHLLPKMHHIKEVEIDGKKVGFEILLILKKAPEKYSQMVLTSKRHKKTD